MTRQVTMFFRLFFTFSFMRGGRELLYILLRVPSVSDAIHAIVKLICWFLITDVAIEMSFVIAVRISKFGIIKVISNFGNFWKQKFMCFWNRLITMANRFLLVQPLHEYMFFLCTSNSVILYYEMWTHHV